MHQAIVLKPGEKQYVGCLLPDGQYTEVLITATADDIEVVRTTPRSGRNMTINPQPG